MKAEINESTLERLSDKNGKTIVRGVDRAMNNALDQLDEFEAEKERSDENVEISCCEKTENLASEPEEEN